MSIQVLDQKNILMFRPVGIFSDKELFSAKCLGFKIESNSRVVADIRKTSKTALFEFMKYAFFLYMHDSSYQGSRSVLFKQIKEVYDNDFKSFLEEFKPHLLYNNIGKRLREHQIEALYLFRYKQFNMLCFEQGVGKTLTAATMSRLFRIKRTIIIGPALVKWNWMIDLTEDWGYDPLYFTILDRAKTIKAYMHERFVILNYEMIEKFFSYLIKEDVGHIILDEVHLCKNLKARRTKSVQKLINHFPRARVSLLTGTPVTNRIVDLFSYLKLCKHPLGKFTYKNFVDAYALGSIRKVTGVKNSEDLRLKLSNLILRKKSEECLDLPELRISKYYFQLEDYQKEYNEAMQELYDAAKKHEELTDEIERLRALKDDSLKGEIKRLVSERRQARGSRSSNLNVLNRIVATAKIPSIIKLIDKLVDEGEKVLVFGSYKKPLQLIHEHYGQSSVYIDGSVTAQKRQQRISEFKKKEGVNVFVGQVIAAGIGINLVNSSKVIFTNFPYTPDQLEQPYKRAHRSGQVKDVDVFYTICRGTVDEHIYRMIQSKVDDINETIDHGKAGAIDYGSLEDKLFNSLLGDFAESKGISKISFTKGVPDKDGFVKI